MSRSIGASSTDGSNFGSFHEIDRRDDDRQSPPRVDPRRPGKFEVEERPEIEHLRGKPESAAQLVRPLRAYRRRRQHHGTIRQPPGAELGQDEPGLHRFAEPDGICQQQPGRTLTDDGQGGRKLPRPDVHVSRGRTPQPIRRPDAADCMQHPADDPLTPAADRSAVEHWPYAIDGHQQRRNPSCRVGAVERHQRCRLSDAGMTDTPSLAARAHQRAGNQSSWQFLHGEGTLRDRTCCDYRSPWRPSGLMMASGMPKKKSAARARMPARREWAVGRRRTRFSAYPLDGLIDASPGCALSASADSGRGPDGVVRRVNSAASPACCGS